MWTGNSQKCQCSWQDNRNRGKTTDEIPCIPLLQKRETAIWPSPCSRCSCVKPLHKNIFFAFQTASPACRWYPSSNLYWIVLTFTGLFLTRAYFCLKIKCTISITLASSVCEKDWMLKIWLMSLECFQDQRKQEMDEKAGIGATSITNVLVLPLNFLIECFHPQVTLRVINLLLLIYASAQPLPTIECWLIDFDGFFSTKLVIIQYITLSVIN